MKAGEDARAGPSESSSQLVQLGTGLPVLPRRLIEKIEVGEHINFGDLPPAKGKGKPLAQAFEGQLVMIQAADLMQSRRLIPDLATSAQCYGIFIAVVARKLPERIPEFMAYMGLIAKASQKSNGRLG